MRLAASGSDINGYTVIAGKSRDNRFINVVVGDFQSDRTTYTLNIKNLPWTSGQNFIYRRYLLDETHDPKNPEETQQITVGSDRAFSTIEDMTKESVQFITLELAQPTATPTPPS